MATMKDMDIFSEDTGQMLQLSPTIGMDDEKNGGVTTKKGKNSKSTVKSKPPSKNVASGGQGVLSQQQSVGNNINVNGGVAERGNYKCSECEHAFWWKLSDAVRCPACGYRVLFKIRQRGVPYTHLAR